MEAGEELNLERNFLEMIDALYKSMPNLELSKITGKVHRIEITSGYIPHGHDSSSWSYRIEVERAYLLKSKDSTLFIFYGNYDWHEDNDSGSEKVVGMNYLPDHQKLEKLEDKEFINTLVGFWKAEKSGYEEIFPWWRPHDPESRGKQILKLREGFKNFENDQ